MIDIGYDLLRAYNEGYEDGKKDAVKWIPVYDQLPDYNMVVLVTDGEDVGTGYRYALGETGFMGWAIPFADIEEDDVSHWMPLPEPPKDGEK